MAPKESFYFPTATVAATNTTCDHKSGGETKSEHSDSESNHFDDTKTGNSILVSLPRAHSSPSQTLTRVLNYSDKH